VKLISLAVMVRAQSDAAKGGDVGDLVVAGQVAYQQGPAVPGAPRGFGLAVARPVLSPRRGLSRPEPRLGACAVVALVVFVVSG